MENFKYFWIVLLGLIIITLAGKPSPILGNPLGDFLRPQLSIQKEKELGEKVLEEIRSQAELVDDPSVLSYVDGIGRKILSEMGPQPFKYDFYVIKDYTLNAFAIPGGHVFINSGLIGAAEGESEIAGVISHEIGHVVSRHIAKRIEKSGGLSLLTLIGILAGSFLSGDAELSGAVATGSMALAQTFSLKYSRDDEWEADQVGFKNIVSTGYDPRGMICILKKIMKQSWLEPRKIPPYLSTHPAAESRIGHLKDMIAGLPKKDISQEDQTTLHRVQVKLVISDRDSREALEYFQAASKKNPENANFHYGSALANQELRRFKESIRAFKKAIELAPQDYEILRDLGICYFFYGKFNHAVDYLNKSGKLYKKDFLTRYYLGRTYQEMKLFDKALIAYRKAQDLNSDFEDIYYHRGIIFGKMNLLGNAHHNLGIFFKLKKERETALFHFKTALKSPGLSNMEEKELLKEIEEISSE